MDQLDTNKCLMDAIPIGEYQEWLSQPATKLLLSRLKEDTERLRSSILDQAKGHLLPEPLKIAALGVQLSSRESLMSYILEHSNE